MKFHAAGTELIRADWQLYRPVKDNIRYVAVLRTRRNYVDAGNERS
jgi:hypothetical protein